ncbi:MAG: hypothetical protein QME42_10070 [bacterium]|nr:hypothetical protein [bacterium]
MTQAVKEKEMVTISKRLWEETKKNPIFVELLEDLEDAQDILKAKSSAKEFFDFNEYVKERRER